MENAEIRLKILQDYLDAQKTLKELQEGYRQSRADWCKAIDAARKKVQRLFNDLSIGQYQQELQLNAEEKDS